MNMYFLPKKVWNLLFSLIILSSLLTPCVYSYTTKIDITNNSYKHNANGVALLKNKKYAQAISEFDLAIAINPNNPELHPVYNNVGIAHLELAKLYKTRGDNGAFNYNISRAELAFKHALYFSPININYYENLADCFILEGKSKKEFSYINNTTYQYPDVMKVVLLRKMGKCAEAEAIADSFIEKNPNLVVSKNLKDIPK